MMRPFIYLLFSIPLAIGKGSPAPPPTRDIDFSHGPKSESYPSEHEINTWVAKRQEETESLLGTKKRETIEQGIFSSYRSKKRPRDPLRIGDYVYDFRKDNDNPKGQSFRRKADEYFLKPQDSDKWEVFFDLDKWEREQKGLYGEGWSWEGFMSFDPGHSRALIHLTSINNEHDMVIELDLHTGMQVEKRDGGFVLFMVGYPFATFVNKNIILYNTGSPAESAMTVYRWKRRREDRATNEPEIEEAYSESNPDVTGISWEVDHSNDRIWCFHWTSYSDRLFYVRSFETDHLISLEKLPTDASLSFVHDWVIVQVKSLWMSYKRDTLLAFRLDDFIKQKLDDPKILFEPDKFDAIVAVLSTRSRIIMTYFSNSLLQVRVFALSGGSVPAWEGEALKVPEMPEHSNTDVTSADYNSEDIMLKGYTVDRQPRLVRAYLSQDDHGKQSYRMQELPSLASEENTASRILERGSATSKINGVAQEIPFFLDRPRENPGSGIALIDIYGGFGDTNLPGYDSFRVRYAPSLAHVIPHPRGDGHRGTEWHHSGRVKNGFWAVDDCLAVAEELRKNHGISSIILVGASHGAFTLAQMVARRPELFAAAILRNPMTDLEYYLDNDVKEYYSDEYGTDRNVLEPHFLGKWIRPGQNFPAMIVMATRKDTVAKVHHAWRLVQLMRDNGYSSPGSNGLARRTITYYETADGDHFGSKDDAQKAHDEAVYYRSLQICIENIAALTVPPKETEAEA